MTAIRKPVFAGSFYDHSPSVLTQHLTQLFDQTRLTYSSKAKGLIVPHAGYVYSGRIAAQTFSVLKHQSYSRIVILGPSHRYSFRGASIYNGTGYETPLGVIPIDTDCVSMILSETSLISYVPKAHQEEHSIEVELPFIQFLFQNDIPIVPIIVGDQSPMTMNGIASVLDKVCCDDTLFIASSDFSHFYTDDQARDMDYRAKELIIRGDLQTLYEENQIERIQMCGLAPIIINAMIQKKRGAHDIQAFEYTNSSERSKDKSSVVGYWGIGYSN